MLPTMFLVPKLYGKIEPLLGMKPRDEKTMTGSALSAKSVVLCLVGFAAAIVAQLLAKGGYALIDWEAAWAESTTAIIIAIVAAAVVALIVFGVIRSRAKNRQTA